MIPTGQLPLDFLNYKYANVSNNIVEHHKNKNYFNDVIPDFIGYSIDDISNAGIEAYCERYNIPLIGWTVRDKAAQQYAESICDNIIIEGAESYI